MNAEYAANFLLQMGEDIAEIKKIVSQPTEIQELNTENAKKLAQLEAVVSEVLEVLHDFNVPFTVRVKKAIDMLENATENTPPF